MGITFKQYINESIIDKGILKAIFVVGVPGAGKSYTISQLKGYISPLVVNTDKATEFISKKTNQPANILTWPSMKKDVQRITKSQLFHYLNGMLPLFIDGTSNDTSNILSRAGILESLGYDVGLIFINTSLKTALKRAKERAKKINRIVDENFIKRTYKISQENKEYFKGKFSFFEEINNDENELTNDILLKAFKKVNKFYTSKIANPVGNRTIQKLKDKNEKYLIPSIFSKETLQKKIDGWYRS
ncbi:MAG: zeta toxin family protein [Candidatus Woesearchaeota archaeon]